MNGLSSPLTKMSRPRREPEDKSLRAAAKSPPNTLGRLSLSPRLAIALALGAGLLAPPDNARENGFLVRYLKYHPFLIGPHMCTNRYLNDLGSKGSTL